MSGILSAWMMAAPHTTLATDEFQGSLKGVAIIESDSANQPPTAQFTHSLEGSFVTFDASSSHDPDGSIVQYKWDFGDGTSATGVQTEHNYNDLKSISVTLTVIDDANGVSLSQQTISAQEPVNTYYLGYGHDAESSAKPTKTPNDSTMVTIDRTVGRKLSIPKGATLTKVWYRFGDNVSATSIKGTIYLVNDGSLLASGLFSSPQANSWASSERLTGNKLFFEEDTEVYVAISVDNPLGFTLTRNDGGNDYFYRNVYLPSSLGKVSSASKSLAIAVEYSR